MTAERSASFDCESFADAAFAVAADAYAATPGDWPDAVHAGLTALFDFLAGSPSLTRMCVEVSLEAGPPALERRDRTLDRFARFLEPGFAKGPRRPPALVAEAIAGAIYELVRAQVRDDRVEAMPEALPVATVIALAPFVGDHEAKQLAARPISVRANR